MGWGEEVVEVVLTVIALIILNFLGDMDKKTRTLFFSGVLFFALVASVSAVFKFITDGLVEMTTLGISFVLTGCVASVMILLMYSTNMIGLGDVLVVLFAGVAFPYVPIGVNVKMFPAIIPVSIALSMFFIFLEMRKTTVYISTFPSGFRRVRRRRANEIKSAKVITEYPVYVEGVGYVYEKVFNGSPQENTLVILEEVSDDALVYTLPNYPFVFYFALSLTFVVGLLLMIGFFELILV